MLRIGGKAQRGIKGSRNARCEGYLNIDVTSGSRIKLGNYSGKDFSPIVGNLEVVDDGRTFKQFENWWQGNKVYHHLDHITKRGSRQTLTKEFRSFQDKWAQQTKGKRVIPETKFNNKRAKPLFAVYDGERYNYAEARWVYSAKYCDVVKTIPAWKELVKLYESDQPIMLIDHDGPRSKEFPEGREVTWEVIEEALSDMAKPYGHAYVLAAMLLSL